MSAASLRIGIETRPIERVPARLALAGVFKDERPLRGVAGRADWRLCGLLSESLRNGQMTGAIGEATLVGSSGRLASDALLVVGLGPRAGYDPAAFEQVIRCAFERVAGLAVPNVVAGSFGLGPEQWVAQARGFVEGALAGLGRHSASVLLCVAQGDETRLRRELVRWGRNTAVDVESDAPHRIRPPAVPKPHSTRSDPA